MNHTLARAAIVAALWLVVYERKDPRKVSVLEFGEAAVIGIAIGFLVDAILEGFGV